MSDAASLFQPLKIGAIAAPNRIVMAPLTRNRANHETLAVHALQAEYYAQRASAGLIVTEATQISQQGQGYAWTPGIYSQAQVDGWKLVTDAVHKAGGRIVLQLWHVGRISHTSLQPNNGAPVAPSAIRANAKTFIETGFVDVSEPRALETSEIPSLVADYARAAENAKRAGFDGVEIHAANGYLLEQFLKDGANKRTDAYGGSVENRARVVLEVTDAVVKVWGADRVGIRLSPVSSFGDITDSNPQAIYNHVVEEVGRRGLAYIHVIEGATGGDRNNAPFDYAALKSRFPGVYIANNGYDRTLAAKHVSSGAADAVAFGVPFIANPDLVERLRLDAPLNQADQATFYGGDAKGYTDYPTLDRAA